MPATVKLTKLFIKLYTDPGTGSCWILTDGAASFSYPLVMIPCNVQNAATKWSFWNSTIITSVFLWKIYTKGLWQKPNPDAVPVVNVLDFLSHLFHTGYIKRWEALLNGSEISRGTQAKIY